MTNDAGQANLSAACALVDALAGHGVRHAVLCPGSRSTPIAVAFAAHPDIRVWVHIDERSASFFALGMARQLREPVALLSTSGTAAANFLPAVAEASLGRVSLVVLTADRPPELRGWGAAQTIDQIRLYGSHARWFTDLPAPVADDGIVRTFRATAARAAQIASAAPAGPVHLNLPFREPLLPADAPLPLELQSWFAVERAAGFRSKPTTSQLLPSDSLVAEIASRIHETPSGIIVSGPGESQDLAAAATSLAQVSGYPILADPLGGLRFGPHDPTHLIDAYDPLLRDRATADRLIPDLILRVGAPPTSKPLQQFLARSRAGTHVVIDCGSPRDPDHLATHYVHGSEPESLWALANAATRPTPLENRWLESWRAADGATRAAIAHALASSDELSEGGVAADMAALLPDGATWIAGNSMPIRDVDAFVRGDERAIRLVGNRGANGIDGMTSTALGAAAVADGPVALLVGDLAFLHDVGGLIAARLFAISATIVVVNNDGGGIFSFLPQAEQLDAPIFEALFGTPTGFDIGVAARLFGASHAQPASRCAFRRDFRRALAEPGLSIVEVVTDRSRNVGQHREVWAAVAVALQGSDAHAG